MTKPLLFAGVGTEVVVQGLLPACRKILAQRGARGWPGESWMLMADSDRRSQNRFREANLPQSQISYTHMSIHQLREGLSHNPDAFKDIWRESWRPLLRDAPDNGASAMPCLGRLMLRGAQATLMHQMEEFRRQMDVTDDGPPDIFVVLNPLSGTSRGSVYELPRQLRLMWPSSTIHALLIYPLDIDRLDRQRKNLYAANFIEALRILDHFSSRRTFDIYIDPQEGWEQREGQLVDNIIVFDGRYGNQRLKQLDVREFRLEGGLTRLFERVAGFISGVATRDRLYDALLSHLSNATLQRSQTTVAGHRAHCHSMHESTLEIHQDTFRRALVERGIARVLAAFAPQERSAGDTVLDDKLLGQG